MILKPLYDIMEITSDALFNMFDYINDIYLESYDPLRPSYDYLLLSHRIMMKRFVQGVDLSRLDRVVVAYYHDYVMKRFDAGKDLSEFERLIAEDYKRYLMETFAADEASEFERRRDIKDYYRYLSNRNAADYNLPKFKESDMSNWYEDYIGVSADEDDNGVTELDWDRLWRPKSHLNEDEDYNVSPDEDDNGVTEDNWTKLSRSNFDLNEDYIGVTELDWDRKEPKLTLEEGIARSIVVIVIFIVAYKIRL
mgnify:CR=1 FL=1